MAQSEESTNVIPIRRRLVDIDSSFRAVHRAGLISTEFAIDGRDHFWGYHDPDRRWNGWATPGFIRGVAGLIADWVNEDEPDSAWWEGDTLHVRSGDGTYVDKIDPDRLGLYHFGGWIWLETDED